MKPLEILSNHSNETLKLGKKISSGLKAGDIVCLFGDLGSGKTTFVKGLAQGLGIEADVVNSPTFVLLNVHEGKLPLYHFDLYRLEDVKEILALGYEEYFYGEGITVVEWAERLKNLMPRQYLQVKFFHRGENQRLIKLSKKT
ncbi:MAG TPA: tRNA (adenosine(37)-N6)-threonylcarbamoyltransferase complex ATPase subunit type 1 TsaE [Candidatus Omnitrophota bacterium]|nr:tRNA (adenosine(37)-N6)-threonylcarbamoyltransferase complex ATPase subunit type 1 TsaE [Candidatus Omnitrophota bacterium]